MTKSIASLLVVLGTTLSAADLSGRWTLVLDPDFSGHAQKLDCSIKQAGADLTLACNDGGRPIAGKIKDQEVVFTLKTGAGSDDNVTATLSGLLDPSETTITGKWHLEPDNRDGSFKLMKN